MYPGGLRASVGRYFVFCSPACHPRLRSLNVPCGEYPTQPSKVDIYLSVLDPLVFNAPREPSSSGGPTRLELRIFWFASRFRNHLAHIRHRLEHVCLSWASKEHQRPTSMLTLITWWLARHEWWVSRFV